MDASHLAYKWLLDQNQDLDERLSIELLRCMFTYRVALILFFHFLCVCLHPAPQRNFEIAFKMFDLNGDGEVDLEEFDQVRLWSTHKETTDMLGQ